MSEKIFFFDHTNWFDMADEDNGFVEELEYQIQQGYMDLRDALTVNDYNPAPIIYECFSEYEQGIFDSEIDNLKEAMKHNPHGTDYYVYGLVVYDVDEGEYLAPVEDFDTLISKHVYYSNYCEVDDYDLYEVDGDIYLKAYYYGGGSRTLLFRPASRTEYFRMQRLYESCENPRHLDKHFYSCRKAYLGSFYGTPNARKAA